MVELEEFLQVFAGIGKAGYLVLPAQFSLGLKPVVKQAFPGLVQAKRVQGYILVAFGLVVRIEGLERLVEVAAKGLQVSRGLPEFDQPLVRPFVCT